MLSFEDVEAFRAMEGRELGVSDWTTVDQATITAFAEVTGDTERIHLDSEAARHNGLPDTIAHGLFTLSLGPKFLQGMYTVKRYSRVFNYGFDTVRFLTPVPVDSEVRMSARVERVRALRGGSAFHVAQTFELRLPDGSPAPRPACVAQAVLAYFD